MESSDPPSPVADDLELPPSALRRHRLGLLGVLGAFVLIGVFWVLVFSGTLTPHNPDRLADRTWVKRAEATCRATEDQVAELPNAGDAPSPAARADTLDHGTALLHAMLADLRADLPSETDERATVEAWLADWKIYLEDRQSFADNLRTKGGSAKPLFRTVHGSTAKETITAFATTNSMSSCGAPLDL